MLDIRMPTPLLASLLLAASGLLSVPVFADGEQVSAGFSLDLDFYESPYDYALPPGKSSADVLAVAIASNDRVYAWYDDGTVSSGTSWNLDAHTSPTPFATPPGLQASDLVAAGIAGSSDHIYYYWSNGALSRGTSTDLDAYAGLAPVLFPPDLHVGHLLAVGIAGSNDHVYAYYADGTVSQGTSWGLDYYADPQPFTLPGGRDPMELAGLGIAGSDDRVYAWYHGTSVGEGFVTIEDTVDQLVLDFLEAHNLAGITVSIARYGRMVLDKGYGIADLDTGDRMEPFHRSRIGSVSKVVTALGVMKHAEDLDPMFLGLLDESVYGLGGLVPSLQYVFDQNQGRRRHTPVVGTAIRPQDDRVFTYYDDGTYSAGSTADRDRYGSGWPYQLPGDENPADLVDVGIAGDGSIYAWYLDGSRSRGTLSDLGAHFFVDAGQEGVDPVDIAQGQSFHHIVGIAIAGSNDRVYAWYEDGTRSSGTSWDLDAESEGETYTVAAGKTPYDLRAMAISGGDTVYAFYGDETVSSGTSWELDRWNGPYASSLAAGVAAQPWGSWYLSITPRHLLTHTAGFDGGGDKTGAAKMFTGGDIGALTYEQIHRYMLRTRRMLFEPGTDAEYSNHGLGVSGFLLEHLTGIAYPTYIEGQITNPLGLDFGRSWDPFGWKDARPHSVNGAGVLSRCACVSSPLGTAAGGWTASAGDLVRLMLATDRDTGHPDILLDTTLDVMESSPYSPATLRALGWARTSQGKLSHGGKTGGGRAFMAKFPEGYVAADGTDLGTVMVAVASNTSGDGIDVDGLVDDIALAIGDAWISSSYDLH